MFHPNRTLARVRTGPHTCVPPRPRWHRRLTPATLLGSVLAMGAFLGTMRAQTLARPGWAGSGLSVDRWWKHAVILDLPNSSDLSSLDNLDTMRAIGVDALLLRRASPASAVDAATPPNTPDSIDDLLREASRRGIRVLVELPADQPAAELPAAARSWATRGVAGFLIPGGNPDALRTVRSAMRAVPGERILISSLPSASSPATSTERRSGSNSSAELQIFSIAGLTPQSDPTQMRATLATLSNSPLITTKDPTADTAAALKPSVYLDRVYAAAVLLLTPGASLIEESWLSTGFGPPSAANQPDANAPSAPGGAGSHTLFDQLRQFTALHHDRPAFLNGPTTLLDHSPEGAAIWLRRGPAGSVLVVVCNLRSTPLRISLADDRARLHLRGTFLKTVSRSDPGLGGMPLSAITLPPFGVYIGELSR